jgi:hypothetical protein
MNHVRHVFLFLALCLPASAFAQANITTTSTTATAIGPTSAVSVWTTQYVGPQTIQVGNRGLCTASCTIGTGGTCGASMPVLTGCASGTPFPIVAGGIDFDTLTLTQITGAQLTPQAVPLRPWVPLGSAAAVALLVLVWRRRASRA